MEMIRDALRPEQLDKMRKLLAGEPAQQVPVMRKKRDFQEGADRVAFENRHQRRKLRAVGIALAAVFAILLPAVSQAQAPSGISVNETGRHTMAVQTLTAVGPSTVVSPDQTGFGKILTFSYVGVSHTGTPANVLSIQGKVGSAYYTLLSTSSIATDIVANLSIGPSI